MGNCVSLSVSLDQSINKIPQWLEKKSGYIRNLKKNLVALEKNMGDLKTKWDYLSSKLTREEDRGRKRLPEFQVWLNSVETIEREVNDILIDRNVLSQRLCLCGFCCKNLRSRYRYGKTVFYKLREVEKLQKEDFKVITEDSYEHEVEERQLPRTIVGQDKLLDRAWEHLMKDEVGIFGLYGLGGVGKTTLLSRINNKFSKYKYGFDLVIWISVSKELQIEKIQDEIAEKVGLGGEEWNPKGKSQKTSKLFNFLKKKKFVLFLDSIWEKVDFTEIGVPFPTRKNKCKVAFTTHYLHVCTCMGVEDPIKVQLLEEDDAFYLFQLKVGEITLQSEPEIPDLARAVARKCCGLPLALDVIGETMSGKKTTQEWHHAIDVLTSNAADLSNIKDKILPLLKYRYDSHKEEQVKSDLQYCASLLPEDHTIDKEILIAEQLNEVDEIQLQPTIVGQETMLDKAWNHLLEAEVGIMGLYGMGGVGKTTLLAQIHNKFSKDRRGFEYVIWVVVSKELHIEKIQDEIAQSVGIGGEEWNHKGISQKTKKLYNFLKKKRFVLFLDDIWEKVELNLIGVPFPTKENKCKVAFTTRSQEICTRMGVEDPMKVQCLAENEAFDLFQKIVGKITLGSDPKIPRLARIVAKKCCGLPLALNVIGETMSSKRTIYGWLHAIEVLTSNAAEFSNMEEKILHLLKYSYDDIRDDQVRSCLLYCALYPEDAKIPKENLIEYWRCEWVNDGSEGIEKAENKGYETISSLVRVSLLMEGVNQNGIEIVYMHDVVREMALWIASDLGTQKEAFIVRTSVGLCAMPKIENWSVVKRMSLMDNEIRQLVGSPDCTELTTLLLQRTELENISSEFFKFMPKLVILDLSGNYGLEFLDGISNIVSLQYLNLPFTDIRQLPKGLPKGLIHLDLEETNSLSNIAGISRVHNLKVLKLSGSRIPWNLNTVKELEKLKHLEILTTTIDGHPGSEQFLRSHRLTSCTRYLDYSNMESSEISLPVTMDTLHDFRIRRCSISEIKMGMIDSLVDVRIVDCQCLREMTFLMFAPNLKRLVVRNAKKLEEVINKEKACEGEESGFALFQNLFYLRLERVPELKNIYWSPLPFQCLKKIEVIGCPNLKKLPLDSKSDNEVIIRYGEREWIESVEWEDEAIKTRVLASCEQI